jgi:hypothetical protein
VLFRSLERARHLAMEWLDCNKKLEDFYLGRGA